jgi:glycosyltransferase involved in cell wall biosynthesis
MKRVVIVGPNIGMGGVERSTTNYANLLAESGWQVTYLALIPDERFFSLHPSVRFLDGPSFNRKHIQKRKTLHHIRQVVMTERPSIILGFTKLYAALANMALIFTRYRVIVLERSSPLYVWPWQVEWFARLSFTLKKCRGIISQTSIAATYQQRFYRTQNVLVLPNPVRQIHIPTNTKKEKWILMVGRLHDHCKGFDRFMQVLDRMKFPDNEWKIVLAGGEETEAGYLLELLKNPEKKERMHFLGKVDSMDEVYAKASIFAIPSRSEGFPNALCEAMAAGLPVVSFDFVAGPRDLIEDGVHGYLVEDGNIPEMTQRLEWLMKETTKRAEIGERATEIGHRLSYAHTAQKLGDFLRSL